jgi:hypothetical protein
MEVSFNKSGEGAVPVTEPNPAENTNTAVQTAAHQGGLVLGDQVPTFDQIILPRVNLVASVGGLKDSYSPGSFLYDQRVILYVPPMVNAKTSKVEREGTPPVIVTVLGFRPTRYVEKVQGGGRGILCNTEEEVRKNSGTLSYQEWMLKKADGMRRFDYLAEALLAIERPETCADDGTVFTYTVEGKQFALGLYAMKGSAYTVAKRSLFTPRSIGCLKEGYPTYSFALSSRLEPTPDKQSTYWLPVFVPNKRSTPEFLKFAASVLAAPQRETDDAAE